MTSIPIIGALAALVVLAACTGQPQPVPCVTDWRTACSGPETNGGDPAPEAATEEAEAA
jgi:hypothetical protein